MLERLVGEDTFRKLVNSVVTEASAPGPGGEALYPGPYVWTLYMFFACPYICVTEGGNGDGIGCTEW